MILPHCEVPQENEIIFHTFLITRNSYRAMARATKKLSFKRRNETRYELIRIRLMILSLFCKFILSFCLLISFFFFIRDKAIFLEECNMKVLSLLEEGKGTPIGTLSLNETLSSPYV
jgi:hypothetical protein